MPRDTTAMTGDQQNRRSARLLVWSKTKMGKVVPGYAKRAADDLQGRGGERAAKELRQMFGQLHQTRLKKFFDEHAADPMSHDARAWWSEQQVEQAGADDSAWLPKSVSCAN